MKSKFGSFSNGCGSGARRVLRQLGGTLLAALLLVTGSGAASALDLNVKEVYGAKGDGSTDDWAPIQQAIADASASPGGARVVFPYGSYRLARPLLLKSNVSLVSHEGAVLTRGAGDSGTNSLCVALSGSLDNVTFEGLIFDGSSSAAAVTIEVPGSNIRFTGCAVRQCVMGLFFNFASISGVSIEGCTFQGIGNSAVAFKESSSSSIRITSSQFTGCYNGIQVSNGVTTSTCNGVTIQSCFFNFGAGSNYPIQFGRNSTDGAPVATAVAVNGCTIDGPGLPHSTSWNPFTLGGGTADQCALYNVRGFQVTNNRVTGGGDSGITLQDTQNGIISGNICNDHYGVGILVANGSLSNISIVNNICENNGRRPTYLPITPAAGGIMVIQATNVIIQGNICPATPAVDGGAHGQPYGLVLGLTGLDVIVGVNDFAPRYPGQAPGGTYLGTGSLAATCTDAAPPVIGGVPGAPLVVPATSFAGATVNYNFSVTAFDQVDGEVPVVVDPPSGSLFPHGLTRVLCTATDRAGNRGQASFTVTVPYEADVFLQPINATGDRSVFKRGRTMPVKFKLTGLSTGKDLSSTAKLTWRWAGVLTATELVNENTSDEGSSTAFRYDAVSGQHIYNLSTAGWREGWYSLTLDLGDGAPRTVVVGVRD